jgi:hypothetical protein
MRGDVTFHTEGLDQERLDQWEQRTRVPHVLGRVLMTSAIVLTIVYVDHFPGTFHLESTADGQTVTDRFIDVSGSVTNPVIRSVVIDVNGLHRQAVVDQSGMYTSRVPLVRGVNTIQAMVGGVASLVTAGSNVVHIVADLPPSDIWSELTWDGRGDIDLHLKLPNGEDCSYQNKATAAGAVLDVDNTVAFGPEHIVFDKAIRGTYQMSVVYFAAAADSGSDSPNSQPASGGAIPWHVTLRLHDSKSTQHFSGVLHHVGEEQMFWTSEWQP